jgi:hypothetical protein
MDPAVPDANEQAHSAVDFGANPRGVTSWRRFCWSRHFGALRKLVKPVGMPASRMMSMHSRMNEPVPDGVSCSRWAKVRSKTRPGRRGTRSHFRKAGISLNGFWIPNFPKRSEAAQNRRKPNETGNFRGNGRPKKNHENWGPKTRAKTMQKRVPNPPESGLENPPQKTGFSCRKH